MLMETLHCGFIPNSGSTLGTIEEVGCGATYSEDIYAPTAYSEPNYASSPVQDGGYLCSNYEDNNNNPFAYNQDPSTSYEQKESALLAGFSDLKVSESSTLPGKTYGQRPNTGKPKKNKSKANKNSDTDRNRKDSFVYDVRMPDEQFLFFVPDMDLVKSHLMFAVREEVEVLKEKILELMDQISSLECENTMLRQYAPAEALQQIQQTQSQSTSQGTQPPHHGSS